MLIPLYVLAAGAVLAGIVFVEPMVGHHWKEFWGDSIVVAESHQVMERFHDVPLWVKLSPVVAGVLGIAVAWWMYIRDRRVPAALAARHRPLYEFLLNKWYFDELYDLLFVRPAMRLGRQLWKGGDGRIIDGLGPDGVSAGVIRLARRAVVLQTGYVYHYAFAILIGVAAFVTWYFSTHFGVGN
jgi:NADH-quinone oxidoreductase subunit L